MKSFFQKMLSDSFAMMPWMQASPFGGALTPTLDQDRPLLSGDVVVGGFLNASSGQGMGANQMLRRFKAAGMPAKGADVGAFLENGHENSLWPETATPGGTAIFHMNPDALAGVLAAVGRYRFSQRRLIGYWVWELEQVPTKWRHMFDAVDEVWVPSRFIADSFQRVVPSKQISVVPYPFDVTSIPTEPREDLLPQFAGKTLVLFAFDTSSTLARKNPEGVIEAFRKATIDIPDAVLILKIGHEDDWEPTRSVIERAIGSATNIHVLRDSLSPEQIKDLVARVDIIMSLHRSEGFGFLMAEGMAAAKPVIATGWSGNVDYMSSHCCSFVNYKLVPVRDPQHVYDLPSAMWAEPDVDHAAVILRKLLQNPAERQRMGKAARQHIEAWASRENWFRHLPESFWLSLPIGTKERVITEL